MVLFRSFCAFAAARVKASGICRPLCLSIGSACWAAVALLAIAVAPGALAQEAFPNVQPLDAPDIAPDAPTLVLAEQAGDAGPSGQASTSPIYVVVGDVQAPGSYPWTEGMTVQSALDDAGGLLIAAAPGMPDDADAEIERTKAKEAVEVVSVAYYAALTRRARLIAERDELEEIPVPDELRRQDYDSAIGDIILGEQQLFANRRAMRRSEIELLKQQMGLFESEIEGLKNQLAATREVGRLLGEERDVVQTLKDKGLVRRTQLLTVERATFAQKADERRIAVEIIRARQDMNGLEVDLNELQNGYKSEILTAIQVENESLARLKRELAGARERFKLQVRRSFENLNRVGAGYGGISITRQVNGSYENIRAGADAPLLAGDVVTVVGFHDTDTYLSIGDAPGSSPDF